MRVTMAPHRVVPFAAVQLSRHANFARRKVCAPGQQFVIENKPGAGTNIAIEMVVRAPADGYTLLLSDCEIGDRVVIFL